MRLRGSFVLCSPGAIGRLDLSACFPLSLVVVPIWSSRIELISCKAVKREAFDQYCASLVTELFATRRIGKDR